MTRKNSLCVAIPVIVGLCFLEIALGSASLSWQTLKVAFWAGPYSHDIAARIIWSLRIPRFFLAFLTGATLGGAGALLQAATRNPLADPFLFGLSSGAATGAVAVIVLLGDLFGIWTVAIGASTGAFLATAVLLLLIAAGRKKNRVISTERVLLSGLAVSFVFSTLTNLLIFWGDRNTAQSVLFWTMGSFSGGSWAAIPIVGLGFLTVLLGGLIYRRDLDALMAGEETAASLGIHVQKLRLCVLVVCAFGCAMTVALCGPIGFVGLIIPHLVRPRWGSALKRSFMPIVVAGGMLTVLADILSRCLLPSQELPVGIVISAIGAAFLLALLLRR
ncbi:iron ABC transporter permease [Gluconobacter japonicus]|uniref:FecCD family ABC transporter permease n=1 Tax=Gluconobacter japonicus TaxID=376620 RepID=UPI0024AD2210|nr:iron ABC transporter permease [Gluconobacter japonicus]MDI6652858.1 iron ABC transporter permease [Gluconobacter japonicus]